jgi:hypothetical protein
MALRNRDRRPEEEAPEPEDTRMLERLAQLERWVDPPSGRNPAEGAEVVDAETPDEPESAESAAIAPAADVVETVPLAPRTSAENEPPGPARASAREIERPSTSRTVVTAVSSGNRHVARVPAHVVTERSARDDSNSSPRALKPARVSARAGADISQSTHSPRLAGTPAEREATRRRT